jgi:hypothetical protein
MFPKKFLELACVAAALVTVFFATRVGTAQTVYCDFDFGWNCPACQPFQWNGQPNSCRNAAYFNSLIYACDSLGIDPCVTQNFVNCGPGQQYDVPCGQDGTYVGTCGYNYPSCVLDASPQN